MENVKIYGHDLVSITKVDEPECGKCGSDQRLTRVVIVTANNQQRSDSEDYFCKDCLDELEKGLEEVDNELCVD